MGYGGVRINQTSSGPEVWLEYGTLKKTSLETWVINLTLTCDVDVRYMKRAVRDAAGHMDAHVRGQRHRCVSPMSVAVITPRGCGRDCLRKQQRRGGMGGRTRL